MEDNIRLERVTSTDVRAGLGKILSEFEQSDSAYLIERRGKPAALLLDIADGLNLLKDGELKAQLRDQLARIYHL